MWPQPSWIYWMWPMKDGIWVSSVVWWYWRWHNRIWCNMLWHGEWVDAYIGCIGKAREVNGCCCFESISFASEYFVIRIEKRWTNLSMSICFKVKNSFFKCTKLIPKMSLHTSPNKTYGTKQILGLDLYTTRKTWQPSHVHVYANFSARNIPQESIILQKLQPR